MMIPTAEDLRVQGKSMAKWMGVWSVLLCLNFFLGCIWRILLRQNFACWSVRFNAIFYGWTMIFGGFMLSYGRMVGYDR
jgi:hypothetical protein